MTDRRLSRDEEDSALAAEYVLGVLDPAERAAAERRIRKDRLFAAWVTRWEADLAALNAEFPEARAPDLLPAIEARLFGRPEGARPPGWWWRFVRGAVSAAVLALLVLAMLPPPPPRPAPGPVLTAALAGEGQALAFLARWQDGELVVARTGGEAPEAGQAHELWVIADGGAPVSLGLLEGAELRRPLPDLPAGAVLAVSQEPAGGSPTGLPTGPVLATGVVAPSGT